MADYSFLGIVFEATDAVFEEIPSLPEAGIPTLVPAKEAMEAIRDANAKDYPIYGETCTHYLTLDTENLAKPNFEEAKYVCSPAVRLQEHRDALWQAVNKGWLNAVSSDHCGFDWKEQKHPGFGDFISIPNGAPGLKNRLGVLWSQGVETGKIMGSKLVDLFATTPAKVNGIGHCKGHIGLGYDADLVLYNPDHRSVISW